MNKQRLFFTCLLYFLLFSLCNAQNDKSPDQKYISLRPIQNDMYRNIVHPVSFSDSTKVFAYPDTTSKILLIIPFNTHLQLSGEGDITKETSIEKTNQQGEKYQSKIYTNNRWYKVELPNGYGYVKAGDVVTHSFTDNSGKFDYFFLTGIGCIIYKYDRTKKQFVDTLEIKSFRGDIIESLRSDGWKNTSMLFRATMINAYCGGGTTNVFIIDANGKLEELITSKFYADDGSADAYDSNVWLPVKFEKGKVLLIANGDLENVFNIYSGQLNTHPFPKELTFPKIEYIVFKETENKSVYNKEGEPVLEADGSYKSKTVKNVTKYFRWNGTKLIQVK